MQQLAQVVNEDSIDKPNLEIVDDIYILKQVSKLAKNVQVKTDKVVNKFSEKLCFKWVNDVSPPKSYRSEYCSATPNVRTVPNPPKKGTAEFYGLMQDLDVPEYLYMGREKSVIDVYYPGWQEYCTELVAQGKPYPGGIDPNETKIICSVTCRSRNKDLV